MKIFYVAMETNPDSTCRFRAVEATVSVQTDFYGEWYNDFDRANTDCHEVAKNATGKGGYSNDIYPLYRTIENATGKIADRLWTKPA